MSDPGIDAAYSARSTVSEAAFEDIMAQYRAESDRAVAGLDGYRDIRYDPDSGEGLDVWGTVPGVLRPVVIAIHGGYWRMLSRHDTAFMAGVLARRGIATVTVDYSLAPHARLEEIVRQVRAAVAWVYRHGERHGLDRDRIFVVGSSAGGHLAAMTAVAGWQADLGLPEDVVKGAMAISGLYDLRPLVESFANEWLFLDEARAAALSPMLIATPEGPSLVVAVAEKEATGFHTQSEQFHSMWTKEHDSELIVVPERNHFDVFLDLADPDATLTRRLVQLVGAQRDPAAGSARPGPSAARSESCRPKSRSSSNRSAVEPTIAAGTHRDVAYCSLWDRNVWPM